MFVVNFDIIVCVVVDVDLSLLSLILPLIANINNLIFEDTYFNLN